MFQSKLNINMNLNALNLNWIMNEWGVYVIQGAQFWQHVLTNAFKTIWSFEIKITYMADNVTRDYQFQIFPVWPNN